MARINITLDQAEIASILADDTGSAFRTLLEESLNGVLRAESAEQLRAAPWERTPERTGRRNGVRPRALVTRLGTLELRVPRHRDVPFRTLVFENYQRSEAALVATMAEMVVAGVSTAKVGRVMEEICGRPFSKQAVSEACSELDAAVEAFRSRPLGGDYLFVMADATYVKARENHRVVAKALMVAVGFTPKGGREVIGVALADDESEASWQAFFSSLRDRGLRGVRMATSDACDGLVKALHRTFPDVAWQRCQAHFARNVAEGAPKRLRAGLRAELTEMFNAPTIEAARRRRDEIAADYARDAPKAVERLDAGFDDAMTVMELPEQMRRCTRTSNCLERLNREIKRRTRVVGVFPTPASALRLAGACLAEENGRWAARREAYYRPACLQLEEKVPKLAKIARAQRLMWEAA